MQVLTRAVRARITYANVMSTIAVLLALGGTATAAIVVTGASIRNGTVTGVDVKNESLTGIDVRNGTLGGADIRPRSLGARHFAAGQLPTGAQGERGPAGEQGPTGPAGPPGPDLSGATHVRVAPDGTPAQNGAALVAAAAAIDDATAAAPVALVLAPGTFDVGTAAVSLPAHVSLIGAGEALTKLTTAPPTNGLYNIVRPGDQSMVTDLTLTVGALPGLVYVNGIFPKGDAEVFLERVTFDFATHSGSFGIMTHGTAGGPATVHARFLTMDVTGGAMPIDIEGDGSLHLSHARISTTAGVAIMTFGGTSTVRYTSMTPGAQTFGGTLTCAYNSTFAGAPFAAVNACA